MMRRAALLLAGLAIVAALAFWIHARSGGSSQAGHASAAPGGPAGAGGGDRVVPVRTARVELRDQPVYLDGLGNVAGFQTVVVRSRVDGQLERVAFAEGQAVKRGDLLAQVDPRPFTIQLHQAEAARARDEALLKNAQLTLDRSDRLVQQKLVAPQQVDDQRAQVDQYKAALQADEAQIENARLSLDYARITSPIDGVTGVRQVDPGNLVHASDANGIVVVTQLDPIAVMFTLPQDDLPQVSEHMAQGTLAVEAYSRDGSVKLGEGELKLIDNQINAATATMRLKAVFPNPDHRMWPNQFVKARLRLTTLQNAKVVPAVAVQNGSQGSFVYVVDGNSVVQPRPVKVGLVQGDTAILASGLEAGEAVVVEGQNNLRPGAKVSAKPVAGADGAPPAGDSGRARSQAGSGSSDAAPHAGRRAGAR